jgi:hypothetical protein
VRTIELGTNCLTVAIKAVLLPLPCLACLPTQARRARGLLWFRFRTLGSLGRRGGATAGATERALDWALLRATAGGDGTSV